MLECGLGRNTEVLPISFIFGPRILRNGLELSTLGRKKRERTVNAERSKMDAAMDLKATIEREELST
jgi:hypothetical protein